MKKIIIWLFERFAFDYWCEIEGKRAIKQVMKENDLHTHEEYAEFLNDQHQEPLKKAYWKGRGDGYKDAIDDYLESTQGF